MSVDPFAPAPSATPNPFPPADNNHPIVKAYNAAQEAPPVSTVPNPFSVKVTLKAAPGYEAEWLNPWVSAETADQLALRTLELLSAFKQHGVIEAVSNAARYTRGQYQGGSPVPAGAAPQQQQAPQPQQQGGGLPPGIEQKHCSHGAMTFKTGLNKWNKPYQAFFCPTPQGTPNQCSAVFL
jgi:hypothetical protein